MANYPVPQNFRDLSGLVFCRLIVLARASNAPDQCAQWFCKCECGNFTIVRSRSLIVGTTKSCGCLNRDNHIRHGHARVGLSPTYRSWMSMKTRCLNPTPKYFQRYGGRGITVCLRWMDFKNFLADMGERPEGTTLDRYPNNNGNYEPGNCRWATKSEQNGNRRKYKKRTKKEMEECRTKTELYKQARID